MTDISTFVKDSGRHSRDDLRRQIGLQLSHPLDVIKQNQWIGFNLLPGIEECVRTSMDVDLFSLTKVMSSDPIYCKLSPVAVLNTFDQKLAFKLFSKNNMEPSVPCAFQKFSPDTKEVNYQLCYKKAGYLEEVRDRIVNGFMTQCERLIYYKKGPLRREQVGDVYIMVKLLAFFKGKGKLDLCITKPIDGKWSIIPSSTYSTEGLIQELIDGHFVISVHTEHLQSCNDPDADTDKTRFLLALLEWIEWRFGGFVFFDKTSLNSQCIYLINEIRQDENTVDQIAVISYWMWTQFANLDLEQCSRFLEKFHFKLPIAVKSDGFSMNSELHKKIRSLPANVGDPYSFKFSNNLIDTVPIEDRNKGTISRLRNIIKFNQESAGDSVEVKELVDFCMRNIMIIEMSERGAGERTISAAQSLNDDLASAPEINSNNSAALMAPILPEPAKSLRADDLSTTERVVITISCVVAGIGVLWGTGVLRDVITATGAERLPFVGKALAAIADTGDLRRQKFATPLLDRFKGSYDNSIYDNLYTEFRKTGYVKINKLKLKIQDFDMFGTVVHLKIDDNHYYATSFEHTENGTVKLFCNAIVKNEFNKFIVTEQEVETLTVVESSLIRMAKG